MKGALPLEQQLVLKHFVMSGGIAERPNFPPRENNGRHSLLFCSTYSTMEQFSASTKITSLAIHPYSDFSG
jgi:hypothetical protein